MPTANRRADRVSWPDLARALGLTREQRRYIVDEGLVTPVRPPQRGYDTEIPREDAERVEQAVRIARAAAVAGAVVIILRLLASGAVKPNVP